MRPTLLAAVVLCGVLCALAQQSRLPRSSPLGGPAGRVARLEGQVLAHANGLPLRRVQVILSPINGGGPAIAAQTDDKGTFVLRDIKPGAYQLSAHRDGYLTTSVFRKDGVRMPPRFTLANTDVITDLTFRMHPWSVIAGKVRFEDGEPAVGMQVLLYRKYHRRGRRGFEQIASAITNDRGEYRAHGLSPGSYYLAVNFEGDLTGPDVQDQPRVDASGKEIPVPSYTTTFYTETTNLKEALPIHLREADDLSGNDIYLRTVQRRKLGGRITDGVSGAVLGSGSIQLERLDSANTGTLPVPIQPKFDGDNGAFRIDNVPPGTYQMWIDASAENRRMVGRSLVKVTNADIDNLELVVLPARPWSGEVVVARESKRLPPDFKPHITLEPRSERGAVLVPKMDRNKFDVALMPQETYDLFVENMPENFFVSAIMVSGVDMRGDGLTGNMATTLPFQVVLDSRGSGINGGVVGSGESTSGFDDVPWPGATVTLIPDPPRNRLQSYREAYADEQGAFAIAGVPPGRYIMTAWFDEPPCDIFDEDALELCRLTGMQVEVKAATQQQVKLTVKPLPRR